MRKNVGFEKRQMRQITTKGEKNLKKIAQKSENGGIWY